MELRPRLALSIIWSVPEEGDREGLETGGIGVAVAGPGVLVEVAGGGDADGAAGAGQPQPVTIIKADIKHTSENKRPFLIFIIPITLAYMQPLLPIIPGLNPDKGISGYKSGPGRARL